MMKRNSVMDKREKMAKGYGVAPPWTDYRGVYGFDSKGRVYESKPLGFVGFCYGLMILATFGGILTFILWGFA